MRKNAKKVDLITVVIIILIILYIAFSVIKKKNAEAPSVSTEDITAEKTACADFNGKRAGITAGSVHGDVIKRNLPDCEIYDFNNYSDLTAALMTDRIDFFLMTKESIEKLMDENNAVSYVDEPLDRLEVGAVFAKTPKGDEIRRQMDEFIEEIRENGALDNIYDYWRSRDCEGHYVDMNGLTGENGTLVFATGGAKQPVSYICDGKIAGSDPDIAVRFCRKYGYNIDVQIVNTGGIIPGITAGTYDFAMSDLVITQERKESVNFSVPYNNVELYIVARKNDIITDKNEVAVQSRPFSYYAQNGKIGVVTGGLYEDDILKLFPDAQVLHFNTQPDLANALVTGKIDAFVCAVAPAEDLLEENDSLTFLDEIFMNESYGFAFGNTEYANELKEKFNEYLAEIRTNGKYNEKVSVWFGGDESRQHIDIPKNEGGENLWYLTSPTMHPYSFIKDGKNAGLEVDIVADFAKKYGYNLIIENSEYDSLLAGVATNTYDIASGTIMITDERAQNVNFSDPYFTSNSVIVVRKEYEQPIIQTVTIVETLKDKIEKNFIRESRWKLIAKGIETTCLITISSAFFGTILAFWICLYRRTGSILANVVSYIYVRILRGTPVVVLLMILYYIVFGNAELSSVWVAVVGFTLNFSAYISEIMRAGIESVDAGQCEAALALGFTEKQAFYKFIFPQAVVQFMPVYKGELISLLKNTSVVGYIAIQDLTKMSDIIRSRTYEAFFPLIVTAIIYFLLAGILALILQVMFCIADPKKRYKKHKKRVSH